MHRYAMLRLSQLDYRILFRPSSSRCLWDRTAFFEVSLSSQKGCGVHVGAAFPKFGEQKGGLAGVHLQKDVRSIFNLHVLIESFTVIQLSNFQVL